MQITEIVVTAARTFNHPYEQYSNLRPSVTLKATLAAGEDAQAAVKTLQQQAETLCEDHKRGLLDAIDKLEQMRRGEQELARLGRLLAENQQRIDELRRQFPELTQLMLPSGDGDAAAMPLGSDDGSDPFAGCP